MASLDDLPFELKSRVERDLRPGEVVRWVGRPKVGTYMLRSMGKPLGFWLSMGFMLVFIAGVRDQWSPRFGVAEGVSTVAWIAFAVASVLLALSPLWGRYQGQNMVYAITDRRALVLPRGLGAVPAQYTFGELTKAFVRHRGSTGGDIVLHVEDKFISDGDNGPGRWVSVELGFLYLDAIDEPLGVLEAAVGRRLRHE